MFSSRGRRRTFRPSTNQLPLVFVLQANGHSAEALYQERLSRLENDKECLILQVCVQTASLLKSFADCRRHSDSSPVDGADAAQCSQIWSDLLVGMVGFIFRPVKQQQESLVWFFCCVFSYTHTHADVTHAANATKYSVVKFSSISQHSRNSNGTSPSLVFFLRYKKTFFFLFSEAKFSGQICESLIFPD